MARLLVVLGLFLSLALGSSLPSYAAPTVAAVLTRADNLLKSDQPDEAYRLLAPLEAQLAGTYQYDYLLGVAALESQRPTTATLALERVVAVKPNFAGARMDLARAYFALGDFVRARAEFEKVLEANPPKLARDLAEKYLDALARQEKAGKPTQLAGYVEFGAGHDTNVNTRPDQDTYLDTAVWLYEQYLPWLEVDRDGFPIGDGAELSDDYTKLKAGFAMTHEVREGLQLYGNVDANLRRNQDLSRFDQDTLGASVGVIMGSGADVAKVGLHDNRQWVNKSVNRDNVGLDVSWQHFYDPTAAVTIFGQKSQIRHNQELENYDLDQFLMGLSWLKALSGSGDLATFSIYLGSEDAVRERPDGNKSIMGLSFGGQKALTPNVALFGNVGVQEGNYARENVAFQAARKDELISAKLGINWTAGDDWSLRAEVEHFINDSNIAINEYDRTDASVILRRDFR